MQHWQWVFWRSVAKICTLEKLVSRLWGFYQKVKIIWGCGLRVYFCLIKLLQPTFIMNQLMGKFMKYEHQTNALMFL